jgi:hypothetical protein
LRVLHRQVFDEHDYYFELDDDDRWPATVEELWADEYVRESGTHSILDVDRVVSPDDADAPGTVRPLTEAERLRCFGTAAPTRADFDRGSAPSLAGATASKRGPSHRGRPLCLLFYATA